jgi:type II secretory pathway pseudopilin PulG
VYMRRIKNKTAFSIIELLLAFAVIVIVFAAVVPQFRAIRNGWAGAEAGASVIQNGRVLAEHLSRNLSAAKYLDSVSADGDGKGYITFIDNNDVKKRYAFSDGYVVFDSGDGSGDQQLAGPIDKFQISCYDANAAATKDVNDIRLIRFETDFPNDNTLGNNKTFSSEVFIRTNDQTAAVLRGDTFEPSSGQTLEFDTADGTFPALVQIDSTHYLCVYTGTGSDGWSVVLAVNPATGEITSGPAFEYDTSDGQWPALAKIDSTRYLCVYRSGSVSNAVVLTVSGTNVSAGAKYQFDSTRCLYSALTQIDASRYLCVYGGTSTSTVGCAIVLTVSGTTVTWGVRYQYDAYGTQPALTQIDSDRYLCAYQGSNSNLACAKVLTVSGTTITSGARYQHDTYGIHPSLWQIDLTHYLCVYGRSGPGNAVVLTVSGTTIQWGARYQFDTSCTYAVLSQIDLTRYLCTYAGSASRGRSVVLTVNPNDWTITKGTNYQYDNSNGMYPALARIDICNYLCAYTGPNSDGWAMVLRNQIKP